MPKFGVSFRRQLTQIATLAVSADTKEQAMEKANAQVKEEDWITVFNLRGDAETKEIREID
jgi:hypothetical protein